MERCKNLIMSQMSGKAKRGRDAVLKISRRASIVNCKYPHLYASLVAMYPEINADAGDLPECPPLIIARNTNDIVRVRHSCVKKMLGLPCGKASCK